MAYTIKYTGAFKAVDGSDYEVNILDNTYTGNSTNIVLAGNPFETQEDADEDIFKPIRKQTGYLRILVNSVSDAVAMYPKTADQMKVVVQGDNGNWVGYVKPESYDVDYTGGPIEVELPLQCSLSMLSTKIFSYNKKVIAIRELMDEMNKALGNQFDDVCVTNYVTNWDTLLNQCVLTELFTGKVGEDGDYPDAMTWEEVMEEVCKYYGWTMRLGDSYLYIDTPGPGNYQVSWIPWEKFVDPTKAITYSWTDRTRVLESSLFPASANNKLRIVPGKKKIVISGSLEDIVDDELKVDMEDKTQALPYKEQVDYISDSKYWVRSIVFNTTGDYLQVHGYRKSGSTLTEVTGKHLALENVESTASDMYEYCGACIVSDSRRDSDDESEDIPFSGENMVLIAMSEAGSSGSIYNTTGKPLVKMVSKNIMRPKVGVLNLQSSASSLQHYVGFDISATVKAGYAKSKKDYTMNRNGGNCAMLCRLKCGKKWYGTSGWQDSATTFTIYTGTDNCSPKWQTGSGRLYGKHVAKDLPLYIGGINGYYVPIPDSMDIMDLTGTMEFEILSVWTLSSISGNNYPKYFGLADLSIKAIDFKNYNSSGEDTSCIKYSKDLDKNSNEEYDVDLKFFSYIGTGKYPYTNLMNANSYLITGKKMEEWNLQRMSSQFARSRQVEELTIEYKDTLGPMVYMYSLLGKTMYVASVSRRWKDNEMKIVAIEVG